MQPVWNFIKVVVIVGLLGLGGYYIWKKMEERPLMREDVKNVAIEIAQIIGEEKTELSMADGPSVEHHVRRLEHAGLETIREGLCMLDPTPSRGQYVAVELILLRMYGSRAPGYVSRIEGDPWESAGGAWQISQFSIDRTPGDQDQITPMVQAFGKSAVPREPWAAEPATETAGT